MKAYDIIGYTYEADIHCTQCSEARFPSLANGEAEDGEGNPVNPIFAYMDDMTNEVCADCKEELT
jgi:uncharacterized protein YuzB (UPF0349 family)